MEMISRKELVILKIILDLYAHYLIKFDLPDYKILLQEYIPTASLFYSNLSYEDSKHIFTTINSNKEISEILVGKMNSVISKTKAVYIKSLDDLKIKISHLTSGIDLSKFYR